MGGLKMFKEREANKRLLNRLLAVCVVRVKGFKLDDVAAKPPPYFSYEEFLQYFEGFKDSFELIHGLPSSSQSETGLTGAVARGVQSVLGQENPDDKVKEEAATQGEVSSPPASAPTLTNPIGAVVNAVEEAAETASNAVESTVEAFTIPVSTETPEKAPPSPSTPKDTTVPPPPPPPPGPAQQEGGAEGPPPPPPPPPGGTGGPPPPPRLPPPPAAPGAPSAAKGNGLSLIDEVKQRTENLSVDLENLENRVQANKPVDPSAMFAQIGKGGFKLRPVDQRKPISETPKPQEKSLYDEMADKLSNFKRNQNPDSGSDSGSAWGSDDEDEVDNTAGGAGAVQESESSQTDEVKNINKMTVDDWKQAVEIYVQLMKDELKRLESSDWAQRRITALKDDFIKCCKEDLSADECFKCVQKFISDVRKIVDAHMTTCRKNIKQRFLEEPHDANGVNYIAQKASTARLRALLV